MSSSADLILTAAMSKFRAQKEEARAVLTVLATSPVGISEHTKLVDEFMTWTRKMAEAEECMQTLRLFASPSQKDGNE